MTADSVVYMLNMVQNLKLEGKERNNEVKSK